MKIGQFNIHRKEQWDLECFPIICIHRRTPNRSARVFCLWRWGLQVGNRGLFVTPNVFELGRRRGRWPWAQKRGG